METRFPANWTISGPQSNDTCSPGSYHSLVDLNYQINWLQTHPYFSVYASLLYLIVIKVVHRFMSTRSPFDLRGALFLWSLGLGLFSIWGTLRTVPELLSTLTNHGYTFAMCRATYRTDPGLVFWHWLFTWSKLVEFGDTVFIVLRRQRLLSLHVIHHVITCIYCFSTISAFPANSRFGVAVNFGIHALMYNYYALKAARLFKVPPAVSMAITALQIGQMSLGIVTNGLVTWHVFVGDVRCDVSHGTAIAGFGIMVLYWGLFANFFVQSYLKRAGLKLNVVNIKSPFASNGVNHLSRDFNNNMMGNGSCNSDKKRN